VVHTQADQRERGVLSFLIPLLREKEEDWS
jgi:hypothetical protein